jgi:anti-sigma regulatory factor (Ser/Thr protein kinase)
MSVVATEFLASASAPRRSREFVADTLAMASCSEEVIAVAQLLVSELATNAVLHAATQQVTVVVDLVQDEIIVQVADDDARLPEGQSANPSEESGRGLSLVAKLSDEWGVETRQQSPGKAVWFRMRCVPNGS